MLNKNNSAHTQTLDIRYKWIIQQVEFGNFQLHHVSTLDMVADGLTKPLTREKYLAFVHQLHLKPLK